MTAYPSPLSERRARQLIETYGGSSALWPEELRPSLEFAVEQYPGLAATLARENALDQKILAQLAPAAPQLIDEIMAQLAPPLDDQAQNDTDFQGLHAGGRVKNTLGGALAAAALGFGIFISPYLTDTLMARSITLAALDEQSTEDVLTLTSIEFWTLTE